MQIQIGKEYATREGLPAFVNFIQPLDVHDEYPAVGFVVADGVKLGMCWSKEGAAGESGEFDLIEEK